MITPANKELRACGLTLPQFELLRKANDNTLERYRVRFLGVSSTTRNALSQGGFTRLDYANDEEKRQHLLNQRDEAIRLAKIALCESDNWRTAFNELQHATQLDSQRDQRMTVISDYGKEVVARLIGPAERS